MTSLVPPADVPVDVTGTYDRLIQPDKVHGSLYTDRQIFGEELRKIWYRTWVFVGHESEVPEPNLNPDAGKPMSEEEKKVLFGQK